MEVSIGVVVLVGVGESSVGEEVGKSVEEGPSNFRAIIIEKADIIAISIKAIRTIVLCCLRNCISDTHIYACYVYRYVVSDLRRAILQRFLE